MAIVGFTNGILIRSRRLPRRPRSRRRAPRKPPRRKRPTTPRRAKRPRARTRRKTKMRTRMRMMRRRLSTPRRPLKKVRFRFLVCQVGKLRLHERLLHAGAL